LNLPVVLFLPSHWKEGKERKGKEENGRERSWRNSLSARRNKREKEREGTKEVHCMG
jgi:hypothetical protein